MTSFDDIERAREHNEPALYERWLEESQINTKPCPSCSLPISLDMMVCDDCLAEWDEEQNG